MSRPKIYFFLYALLPAAVLLAFALALSGCKEVQTTSSASLVRAQAWRMDASTESTLEDAAASTDWQPMSEWKSWGYGPEVIWLRLQLNGNDVSERTPWFVRVQPTYLDHVTFFDPVAGLELHKGNEASQSNDELSSTNFTLQIPALPHERTVYLKIRTTSTRTLNVDVMPYEKIVHQNQLMELLMVFIISTSAIFAVWAFAQWCFNREQVIVAFALKQAFITCYLFFNLGLARFIFGPWLSEGNLTSIRATLLSWTISFTIWFFVTLLQGYLPNRYVIRAMLGLATMTAMLPVLQWVGHSWETLMMSQISTILGFVLLLIAMLSALPKKISQPIPSTVLLIYLVAYCSFSSVIPLINLGWIPANSMTPFGGLPHAVLDGVVMFVLLQIREQNLRKEKQQIKFNFERSLEAVALQKRHREEKSQLFDMLAHEIKTPLATLRMWMEAGGLKPETLAQAIADMNQVIERCVHTDQLADQGLKASPQLVNAAELTRSCIQSCRAALLVDFAAPESKVDLETDAQMLSIALSNLLDNACKYGAPYGRIHVTLAPVTEDGRAGWSWQVSNQVGPAGLPDPELLFNKYYRSPQALRFSGSGLGLFLVKGLLDLLHGSIHYKAQKDQVNFCIWVPLQFSAR